MQQKIYVQQMEQTQVKKQVFLSYKRLVLMWVLILLGYFLFVVQWYGIINFIPGWGQAFFVDGKQSELVQSVPNWTITLGRAVGSVLAGYFIAKFGHKYAVIFVLSLMVISFPFIIVAQNQSWNALSIAGGAQTTVDGNFATAVPGYSLFVIFRTFLGVGGTTLIAYTNSVIAKMPQEKRAMHVTFNSLGFNVGAAFANVFFIIPAVAAIRGNENFWIPTLSILVILVFAVLVAYLVLGLEVVPRRTNAAKFAEGNNQEYTLLQALKEKKSYTMGYFYVIWLLAVVFSNSTVFRDFIEQSPVNTIALINDNIANNSTAESISASVSYFWVFRAFIVVFVLSYIVSIFTVARFRKTIYSRKIYIAYIFGTGVLFLALAVISGYFGGYANPVSLFFFLFFGFCAGVFLWGTQPIFLTIPQQEQVSNPQYVGIMSGVIWGLGYFGYTFGEASLGSILTYVDRPEVSFATQISIATAQFKALGAVPAGTLIKSSETAGSIMMIVFFFILMLTAYSVIKWFPKTGYSKDGTFHYFDKTWHPFKLSNFNWKQAY